jgi:ABC-type branched-subunit amino acid transport system substrate-binding protein
VKLIYYDDPGNPPNVPALYMKLLDVDKVDLVVSGSHPPGTADYAPIVRSIGAAHADVVYIASYPADTVWMVNALHEVGLKARLVGGSGITYPRMRMPAFR